MPPAEVASPTGTLHSHPSHGPFATYGEPSGALTGRAPTVEEPLPESVRVVLDALRAGPRTYRDLVAATSLPGRTVRWAVRRLRNLGLVDARASLRDGRSTWFFLSSGRARPRTRAL